MKNWRNILFVSLYISVFTYGSFLIKSLNKIDVLIDKFEYIKRDALLETSTLSLVFNNGLIRVYDKDKLLTEGKGLFSSFNIKGVDYDLSNALCRVEKISPVELVVVAQWPDLTLQLIWRLRIGEGLLNWQIDLESEKQIEIKDLYIGVSLKDKYKEWTNINMHGVMPKLSYGQDYNQLRPNVTFGIIGFNGDFSLKDPFPYLVFNAKESLLMNKIELQSCRDTYTKFISSNIVVRGLKDELSIQGSKTVFQSQLFLFDKEQDFTRNFKEKISSKEISQGDLKLFFDQGHGSLFWKGKLLTEDEGISIMYLYSKSWYTSLSDTLWNYEKISANRIIIQGRLVKFPISYILEFEIVEGNTINYKIDIEAYKNISLAEESFIIMIADAFNKYIIPTKVKMKSFPLNHINSYQWIDVWRESVDFASKVGVVNTKDRNAIILHCAYLPGDYYLTISNTNKRHNARVLIHSKNKDRLSVGRHTLFIGKIEIYENYEGLQ